jgi:hypothetical protein
MRRCGFYTVILLLSIAILPVTASSGVYEEWLDGEKLSNTFDELLRQYDGSSCEGCHADIAGQWRKSFHAQSITASAASIATYLSVGIQSEWNRQLTAQEAAKCLDCHIPQIDTATPGLAREIADMVVTAGGRKVGATDKEKKSASEKLSKLSINCVVCHNMKSISASPFYLGSKHKHFKTPTDKDRRDDYVEAPLLLKRRQVHRG